MRGGAGVGGDLYSLGIGLGVCDQLFHGVIGGIRPDYNSLAGTFTYHSDDVERLRAIISDACCLVDVQAGMVEQAGIAIGGGVFDFLRSKRAAVAGNIGNCYGLSQHILQIHCIRTGIEVRVAAGTHGHDHVDGLGGPVGAALFCR